MPEPGSRIRILSEATINKVAAGEVVERPAAALKELVENSIDAGAGRIEISIERAGRALIRVRDDGRGMTHDDVLLALERHSTSKITDVGDLEEIGTLGFRGEALPSMAAVSRMQITTRSVDSDEGTRIIIDGGKVLKVSPCGAPVGTEVEIRRLFKNVPARLKFLKTDNTELSHCLGAAARLALANPEVGIVFSHGSRKLLNLPPAADESGRLRDYLGAEFFRHLLPFEVESGSLRARGFVARPGKGRQGSDYQQFFVNSRPVREVLLLKGIREACRDYFLKESTPLSFFIWIDVPPGEVDVNVHPAKREVRFRNLNSLRTLLGDSIRDTLRRDRIAWFEKTASPAPAGTVAERPATYRPPPASAEEEQLSLEAPVSRAVSGRSAEIASPAFQLFATYLVLVQPEGLVLVDQHAAHERILYEKVLRNLEKGKNQRLLHPAVLELSPAEESILEGLTAELEGFGIEIEPFGPRTFRLTSLPFDLPEEGAIAFVRELIERVRRGEAKPTVADLRGHVAALMACHGSVRANQKLEPEEAQALLKDLFLADDPAHCPHGRPTFILLERDEIEKRFKRS
jgi:DNA mismatch repair protein MutL